MSAFLNEIAAAISRSSRVPFTVQNSQAVHGGDISQAFKLSDDSRSFLSKPSLPFGPAVYFGDRNCDLARTELFGGFAPEFYAAYREAWPLDAGYAVRKTLYNLYHVLNHANLFGGSYVAQATRMIAQLLAQIR